MTSPTVFTDLATTTLAVGGVDVTPGWRVAVHEGTAFTGSTNAHGDYDGTGNPVTLFTVTGVVEVRVFAVCGVNLAGANATIEIGVASNTACLIAQSTGTDVDAGEIWLDATPVSTAEALTANSVMINGADIIETLATANLTGGQIDYYCIWRPISAGATVVAA